MSVEDALAVLKAMPKRMRIRLVRRFLKNPIALAELAAKQTKLEDLKAAYEKGEDASGLIKTLRDILPQLPRDLQDEVLRFIAKHGDDLTRLWYILFLWYKNKREVYNWITADPDRLVWLYKSLKKARKELGFKGV